MTITIRYERDAEGRWIAEIPEFPGAIACGPTKAHAKAAATAVAREIALAERDDPEPYKGHAGELVTA